MTRPAPDALTQDRVEDRAHGQRQALVEGEDRQRQTNDGIGAPGVQAPVEDGGGHAQRDRAGLVTLCAAQRCPVGAQTILAHADAAEGGAVVAQRLRYAIEHQADAHAGGEQHGEPAGIAEVRLGVGTPDTHLAHGGEDQHQREYHEDVGAEQKHPGQLGGQEAEHGIEDRLHLSLHGQRQDHEQQDHDRRDHEDRAVQIHVDP